jgi:hypothetical protein
MLCAKHSVFPEGITQRGCFFPAFPKGKKRNSLLCEATRAFLLSVLFSKHPVSFPCFARERRVVVVFLLSLSCFATRAKHGVALHSRERVLCTKRRLWLLLSLWEHNHNLREATYGKGKGNKACIAPRAVSQEKQERVALRFATPLGWCFAPPLVLRTLSRRVASPGKKSNPSTVTQAKQGKSSTKVKGVVLRLASQTQRVASPG